MKRHFTRRQQTANLGSFDRFLSDPVVALAFLVFGLVALVLALLEFGQIAT